MSYRLISFPRPELVAIPASDDAPPPKATMFGLAEYLVQSVFAMPYCYEDQENAELVQLLEPQLRPLLGEADAQAEFKLRLEEDQWKCLCKLAKPRVQIHWMLTRQVAAFLIALYAAQQVTSSPSSPSR